MQFFFRFFILWPGEGLVPDPKQFVYSFVCQVFILWPDEGLVSGPNQFV